MYVYSGKCRLCEVGVETDMVDRRGDNLFTGDIVVIWTENYFSGMTVVVGNQFQSYTNGTHELLGFDEKFIMGIKQVRLEDGEWSVIRVKSFSEVVEGEHWASFGFSFSNQ